MWIRSKQASFSLKLRDAPVIPTTSRDPTPHTLVGTSQFGSRPVGARHYKWALFDACAALTCPQCARMVCMVCFLTGDDSNAMHLHIRQSHPEGSAEDWRPSAFLREPYVREKQRQVRLPFAKAYCFAPGPFPAARVIQRCSSFLSL